MAQAPSPVLVTKFKDGIKDAVVFLRMLEGSTKLSAIVERKRKELLEQLLSLLGDSLREEPPSYEPKDNKPASSGETGATAKASGSVTVDKKANAHGPSETSVAKQPENATTLDKKQAEKIASLEKKQPEKTDACDKNALVNSLDKKQPEKAGTLKKESEKTPTFDKKLEAAPQENSERLKETGTGSPLLGKKNKKNADVGKDEATPSSTSSKGSPQNSKKTGTATDPPEAAETQSSATEPQSPTDESQQENGSRDSSQATTKNKKQQASKGVFGGVKSIFSSKKKEREGSTETTADPPPAAQDPAAVTSEITKPSDDEAVPSQDYCTPQELQTQEGATEQQGKLSGQLERQVKGKGKFAGSSWIKQLVTLKDDCIVIDSQTIPLSGCTVKDKGNTSFKLTSPDSEEVVLRVESEEMRKHWVAAVSDVITACTPIPEVAPAVEEQDKGTTTDAKEKSLVPAISVTREDYEETGPGAGSGTVDPIYKNVSIKGSSESLRRNTLKMPDQRVATMKGIVYRKNWHGSEKRWALLTSEPCLYLSQSESSTECIACLPLEQGFLEQKKGNNKSSASFVVKSGKNKETFTVQGEISEWHTALEVALGITTADLELASSDEDGPESGEYEDVNTRAPPPIPSSPRPAARVSVATSEQEDVGGECIYEECNDTLNDPPPCEAAPSLPLPRTIQKEPLPSLPQREARTSSSATSAPAQKDKDSNLLPARNPPNTTAGIPARPKPPPTVTTVDRKLADKPVKGPPPPPDLESEEVYDDIALPQDDNLYEDTAAAVSPSNQDDEYVDVERHDDGEEYTPVDVGTEEEYIDVETKKPEPPTTSLKRVPYSAALPPEPQPALPLPPRASQSPAPHTSPAPNPKVTPAAVKNKVSSLSVMFDGNKKKDGGGGGGGGSCSGQLMHKNLAKGSTYREEWAVLEGGATSQQAVLNLQRTATDKKAHTQLSIHDQDLTVGKADPDGGDFQFKLTKGDVHHLFSVKTQEDMDKWMLAIRPLAKCVIVSDPKCIYEVKENHTPTEGGDSLSLKKGTFVQVLKDKTPTVWIGQCGNYHDVFSGPIGAFPSSKVVPVSADDVYM